MARAILVLFALIHLVRFTVPAFVGDGPFGVPWLAQGNPTRMLDSDIRYWGVLCATVAALFGVLAVEYRKHLGVLDLVMVGVLIGGGVRFIEMGLYGVPEGPAVVAAVLEVGFPLAWWVATARDRAAVREHLEESVVILAPASQVWSVYADFADVDAWHPYMERAQLVDGPETGVGAARDCWFGPNMAIRETVQEWSPGRMVISIGFLKGIVPPLADILAAVRVEPLGESCCRLVLTMTFRPTWGPVGSISALMAVKPLYRWVFGHMLAASEAWAVRRETVPPVVMPLSGRALA